MNYGQKLYWKHILHNVLFIVISIVIVLLFFWHYTSTFDKSQAMKEQYQTTEMGSHSHKSKVQRDVIKDSANSNSPTLRAIGKNNQAIATALPPVRKFLSTYYNWSGQGSFNARRWKLKNVATNNVIQNKGLFANPKNYGSVNPINSVLNNLNMSILSWKGNNLTLLTNAYYTAWNNQDDQSSTTDYSQNGGSSTDKSRNNGSQWMIITVNMATHKISNVKMTYLNPQAHESASNSTNQSNKSGAGVPY